MENVKVPVHGAGSLLRKYGRMLKIPALVVLDLLSLCFLAYAVLGGFWCRAIPQSIDASGTMDRIDMYMTNEISGALDGVLAVEKHYWLSDSELVAPEPVQTNYGTAQSAAELQWLLDEAGQILDGQDTLFTVDTPTWSGSEVMYYLDETIFAVTWKQLIDDCIYTFSEVKIAHSSQFRRFLAGGEYGSDKQYVTTDMAASVNAVVASSGDFYKYRRAGIIVYDGVVQRIDNSANVDTCCIDDEGNLILIYRGQILDMETAQKFVDDNNIRFSVAFGPILVDNGQRCEPYDYELGEVNMHFPRAALCQRGALHYVIVVSNREAEYYTTPTIHTFAARVAELGCEKAYTLDGGQTAVIAMNDQLINAVHFGSQRQISDIIYFATALPGGG